MWSAILIFLFLLRDNVYAEIRANLIAEHTSDAFLLMRDPDWTPADFVRLISPGKNIHGAYADAKATRLTHLLVKNDIPLASFAGRRLDLFISKKRHDFPVRLPTLSSLHA